MTQDQIEHLAHEYGDTITDARGRESFEFDYHGLARLVAAVEAAERERCALLAEATVCDQHLPTGIKIYGTRAAKAIRGAA